MYRITRSSFIYIFIYAWYAWLNSPYSLVLIFFFSNVSNLRNRNLFSSGTKFKTILDSHMITHFLVFTFIHNLYVDISKTWQLLPSRIIVFSLLVKEIIIETYWLIKYMAPLENIPLPCVGAMKMRGNIS